MIDFHSNVAGDVVGCYLAIQSGWLSISYKMNKCYLGDAFKMRWVSDEVNIYF